MNGRVKVLTVQLQCTGASTIGVSQVSCIHQFDRLFQLFVGRFWWNGRFTIDAVFLNHEELDTTDWSR